MGDPVLSKEMGSVSTTTIVATLFLYFTSCSAITFKTKTRKPEHTSFEISEGFYFPPENVFAENGTFSSDNTNTTARGPFLTAEDLSKSTLDERCDRGLPISASLQYYGPYAKASTKMDLKLGVEGIFPHLINKMLHFCCNASTVVSYGKIIKTIRKLEGQLNDPQSAYDLTFPITGISEDDMVFKDLQFIPIVQAPRVALLVLDKDMTDQTSQLLMTVTKAWPILVFIIVAATLSGIIIWALDRLKNPDEFPPPFISGTWEGFWWAFVTMTTVGYGDRAPKSLLARIFCIVWILVGIIIIAIFTAIITASLSASIQHHFTVHGSKVGAVSGSEEQRLGVSLNADMSPYESITDINAALLNQTLNGSLIDNYVLTHYSDYVKKHPVRIETTYNHPITYGIVLRENSTKMVKCFRSYVRNHPQEVFEIIAKNLQPLKNPTDAESQEVKASRELFFYREPAFKYVLHVLLGVVGFLLLFGALWELLYRKPKARQLQAQNRENAGPYLALAQMQGGKCDCHEMMLNHQTIQSIKDKSLRIKELIKEYEEFYEKWLSKVRDVEHDDNGHITPNMV